MSVFNVSVTLSGGKRAVLSFVGFTSDKLTADDVDALLAKIGALRPKEPAKKAVKKKTVK